jgi:hypothetical protein
MSGAPAKTDLAIDAVGSPGVAEEQHPAHISAQSGIYGQALSYRVEGAVTLRHGADFVAHTTSRHNA